MPSDEFECSYVRAAAAAMLDGRPFETLVDACRRQAAEEHAAKLVDFAAMRRKLRPRDADPAARICRPDQR